MVIVTIVKLYVIQMLIGQDFRLIEDLLLHIMFLLVIIWFLGKARNNMLWQDLVLKQNIKLWPHLPVSLFGLKIYLKNYNLERSLEWHLYVIIRLLFILAQILSLMKGLNILRLIIISFERKLYLKTSRLNLLIRMIDQLADIFTKSLWGPRIDYICSKLGSYDLYKPTWGRVLHK